MIYRFFAILFLSIFSLKAAIAHDSPKIDPNNLVPIPDFTHLSQFASGAKSTEMAKALIATLTENQKQSLVYKFSAPVRNSNWNNLPSGIKPRLGLRLGDLNVEQLDLVFRFLAHSLQADGYKRVADVMAAEAFLSTGRRAKRLKWSPENYWLTFYGPPSETEKWAWHFGGHHLGLNLTVNQNKVNSMSPSFVGTEPAVFNYGGTDYTAVRDMHKAVYDVFNALNTSQQKKALKKWFVPDRLLTGPGKDHIVPDLGGIAGENLNENQQTLLLKAIAKWVNIQPQENATVKMQEIEQNIDSIHFLWSGSYDLNKESYARIQGKTFIIELLSTSGNVGQSAKGLGHYHTIYRNTQNDYGLAH